jgi:multidrug efflux pump subunit AcrA (membrane-fusion protein)
MIRLTVSCSLAFLLFGSCKSKQEKIKPVEEKITESVYASGIVKSDSQYQVFASVSGLVAEILVTEGDIVKKGDALMRLTNTTAQLNTENATIAADYTSVAANTEKLNELKIAIDLAKEKMDNDASLLQRQQNLWTQNIGTRNEVDLRDITHKSSVNAWESAKLHFSEMQKQISFQAKQSQKNLQISKTVAGDYTIRSERNGRVYSILKEKGEMVNTQGLVALVGDASAFTLALQVDEYDIARVKTGQKILLTMDSYKGQAFEAVVEKIYPIMNDRTKSFTVDARFVKQPAALYPNLTCEANIVIQQKEKALLIPRNYLLEGDYILLENKEKKKVTVGLKDYQQVEILSGLTVNDYILKPAL